MIFVCVFICDTVPCYFFQETSPDRNETNSRPWTDSLFSTGIKRYGLLIHPELIFKDIKASALRTSLINASTVPCFHRYSLSKHRPDKQKAAVTQACPISCGMHRQIARHWYHQEAVCLSSSLSGCRPNHQKCSWTHTCTNILLSKREACHFQVPATTCAVSLLTPCIAAAEQGR